MTRFLKLKEKQIIPTSSPDATNNEDSDESIVAGVAEKKDETKLPATASNEKLEKE